MLKQNLNQRKKTSWWQMETFNQIPGTGLACGALSVIMLPQYISSLVTNHTLRDVEGQNLFFPLTHVKAPHKAGADIASVLMCIWKWTISFLLAIFFLCVWDKLYNLYLSNDFAPYLSCRVSALMPQFTTVLEQAIQEPELTSHKQRSDL